MKIFIFLLLTVSLICSSLCTSQYTIKYQLSNDGMCGGDVTQSAPNPISIGQCFAIDLGEFGTHYFKLISMSAGFVSLEYHFDDSCTDTSPSVSSAVTGTTGDTCAGFMDGTNDMKVEVMGAGGGGGDPHFTPISENKTISKMKYTPVAKEDGIYNIFSNKRIQWNSYFKTYQGLYDIIHLSRQFILTEYYVIKSPIKNAESVKISFKVATDKTRSKYPFLQPTINQLVSAQKEQKKTKEKQKMRKFIKSQSPIPFRMPNGNKRFFIFGEQHPEYFIETPNLYNVVLETPFLKIKARLTFFDFANKGYLSKKHKRELGAKYTKFDFPYFDTKIQVVETVGMKDSHGILGQTMRPECPYKEPYNECVQCFMKGETKDYRIEKDQPFGTKFKFNKFE